MNLVDISLNGNHIKHSYLYKATGSMPSKSDGSKTARIVKINTIRPFFVGVVANYNMIVMMHFSVFGFIL